MPKISTPPTDLDQQVGANVRRVRRAQGLKQAELAARIGASQQKIHMLESGRTRACLSEIVALARALETPFSTLAPVAEIEAQLQAERTAQARARLAGIEGWRWRLGNEPR